MDIKLYFWFCDDYGANVSANYTLTIPAPATENDIEVAAEDALNDWFFDVADQCAREMWLENGGGTKREFEDWFGAYVCDCTSGWEYVGDYDDTL